MSSPPVSPVFPGIPVLPVSPVSPDPPALPVFPVLKAFKLTSSSQLSTCKAHVERIDTPAIMFGNINFGSFWGIGMVFLQALRGFTIIGLMAAQVACWTLVIKVDTGKTYFVFDAASLVFTSSIAAFLKVSELPIGKNFYRNHWPAFSDRHGLGWLGLACIIIGCNILGKLNNPNNEANEIGMSWWQLAVAAGILNLTFGALNVIAALVFRNGKDGINSRDIRSKGAMAESTHTDHLPSYNERPQTPSVRNEKTRSKFMSRLFKGGNDDGKDHTRPHISAPMPAHHSPERNDEVHHEVTRNDDDILRTDQMSPIAPGMRRPDSALHPMNARRASSRYSEAHMSRF